MSQTKSLPDSDGWWWCREKSGHNPGDELCVEVTVAEDGSVLVRYGRDCDHIHPERPDARAWFYNLEWIKTASPFSPLWICGCVPETGQWEVAGVFTAEERAVEACKDATYFVAPLYPDSPAPTNTTEFPDAYYPRATSQQESSPPESSHQAVSFFGKSKPSEFLQAMLDGVARALSDPACGVEMSTFGSSSDNICYGCAATWALHALAAKDPETEALRARSLTGWYPYGYFGDQASEQCAPRFETVIDCARRGSLAELAEFCGLAPAELANWECRWYLVTPLAWTSSVVWLESSTVREVQSAIEEMREAGL